MKEIVVQHLYYDYNRRNSSQSNKSFESKTPYTVYDINSEWTEALIEVPRIARGEGQMRQHRTTIRNQFLFLTINIWSAKYFANEGSVIRRKMSVSESTKQPVSGNRHVNVLK